MQFFRRSIVAIISLVAALWVAATGFLYINQDAMIFPVPPVKPIPAGYETFEPVTIETPDGERLNVMIHPAEAGEAWVIGFHGNGGDVIQFLPEASVFERAGFGVLIGEYRGYNASTGSPSQEGLYIDALAAFDAVREMSDAPVFLYAHSLGTAMAIHVGENRQAAGLALLSPFDSVLAVAQARYPMLWLEPFLNHPFPSVDKIASIEAPIVIYHGDEDRVVPIAHGEALAQATADGTRFERVAGAAHNDMFARGVTQKAAEFFRSILSN